MFNYFKSGRKLEMWEMWESHSLNSIQNILEVLTSFFYSVNPGIVIMKSSVKVPLNSVRHL